MAISTQQNAFNILMGRVTPQQQIAQQFGVPVSSINPNVNNVNKPNLPFAGSGYSSGGGGSGYVAPKMYAVEKPNLTPLEAVKLEATTGQMYQPRFNTSSEGVLATNKWFKQKQELIDKINAPTPQAIVNKFDVEQKEFTSRSKQIDSYAKDLQRQASKLDADAKSLDLYNEQAVNAYNTRVQQLNQDVKIYESQAGELQGTATRLNEQAKTIKLVEQISPIQQIVRQRNLPRFAKSGEFDTKKTVPFVVQGKKLDLVEPVRQFGQGVYEFFDEPRKEGVTRLQKIKTGNPIIDFPLALGTGGLVVGEGLVNTFTHPSETLSYAANNPNQFLGGLAVGFAFGGPKAFKPKASIGEPSIASRVTSKEYLFKPVKEKIVLGVEVGRMSVPVTTKALFRKPNTQVFDFDFISKSISKVKEVPPEVLGKPRIGASGVSVSAVVERGVNSGFIVEGVGQVKVKPVGKLPTVKSKGLSLFDKQQAFFSDFGAQLKGKGTTTQQFNIKERFVSKNILAQDLFKTKEWVVGVYSDVAKSLESRTLLVSGKTSYGGKSFIGEGTQAKFVGLKFDFRPPTPNKVRFNAYAGSLSGKVPLALEGYAGKPSSLSQALAKYGNNKRGVFKIKNFETPLSLEKGTGEQLGIIVGKARGGLAQATRARFKTTNDVYGLTIALSPKPVSKTRFAYPQKSAFVEQEYYGFGDVGLSKAKYVPKLEVGYAPKVKSLEKLVFGPKVKDRVFFGEQVKDLSRLGFALKTESVFKQQVRNVEAQRFKESTRTRTKELEKLRTKTLESLRLKTPQIYTPKIPVIRFPTPKPRFKPKEYPVQKQYDAVMSRAFVPAVRKKGRFVAVSRVSLPKFKALNLAGSIAQKTTARTIKIVPFGFTQQKDVVKSLWGFRKGKQKDTFVEINKAAINTLGEKFELRQARRNKKGRFFF